MELLAAALAMALRDGLATLLVLAETKNRAIAAGALDALNDLATILVTVFGAGEVIVHGWGLKSVEIVVVMMLTSFIGTVFWTRMGHKLLSKKGQE